MTELALENCRLLSIDLRFPHRELFWVTTIQKPRSIAQEGGDDSESLNLNAVHDYFSWPGPSLCLDMLRLGMGAQR